MSAVATKPGLDLLKDEPGDGVARSNSQYPCKQASTKASQACSHDRALISIQTSQLHSPLNGPCHFSAQTHLVICKAHGPNARL